MAVVGLAAWGIWASLQNTTQISDFWSIIDKVESKVNGTVTALRMARTEVEELRNEITMLNDNYAGGFGC